MMKKKYLAFTALAIPASLLLAGCSVGDLSGETYDKAESKSAATSEDGVKSGLSPKMCVWTRCHVCVIGVRPILFGCRYRLRS